MPDKVFTVLGKYEYDMDSHMRDVNAFLTNNPNYEVKSVTQVVKPEGKSYGAYAGVVIVVGERKGE
ncbi:MAG: hypothetical protein NC218_09105 [Acetobacter sp.]|nr:hypothetical protein [Acetobacter sp.]